MKEKRTIELGYETPDYDCCAEPSTPKKMKMEFPCLYVRNAASLKGIPMEGTATIKYRLAGFNDRSGSDPSMDLEVQSIEVEADPAADMENSEESFEANMQSAEEKSYETEDEAKPKPKKMASFGKSVRIDSSKSGGR